MFYLQHGWVTLAHITYIQFLSIHILYIYIILIYIGNFYNSLTSEDYFLGNPPSCSVLTVGCGFKHLKKKPLFAMFVQILI